MTERAQEIDSLVTDARIAELTARLGDRLSAEQVEQVRGRIAKTLELARTMRSASLSNADEPDIAFSPYRGES
jgi:hypothetical protein